MAADPPYDPLCLLPARDDTTLERSKNRIGDLKAGSMVGVPKRMFSNDQDHRLGRDCGGSEAGPRHRLDLFDDEVDSPSIPYAGVPGLPDGGDLGVNRDHVLCAEPKEAAIP